MGIQFLLFMLYLFEFDIIALDIPNFIRAIGLGLSLLGTIMLIIAILQLNKNLSPFPTPRVDGELIKTGLYKLIRHPIYSGILITMIGYSLKSESSWKLLVTLLLYALFHFKMRFEEKKLKEKFIEYEIYMKTTGRLLPKIGS